MRSACFPSRSCSAAWLAAPEPALPPRTPLRVRPAPRAHPSHPRLLRHKLRHPSRRSHPVAGVPLRVSNRAPQRARSPPWRAHELRPTPTDTPTSQHRELAPFPAVATPSIGYAETATLTEGALAKAPETSAPASIVPSLASNLAPNIESLRHGIGSALVHAGHSSAAQLLGAATWVL